MARPARPGATSPRHWPVRLILVGVVFALVLPGLVFACVLIARITTVERTRSEEGASAAALRAAETLDREIANLTVALRTLATSPTLAAPSLSPDDLAAFATQARAAAGPGRAFSLCDPQGQQLLNTNRPDSDTLPHMADVATLRRAVETRRPAVSNLFTGAASGQHAVAVMFPLVLGGRVTYVLSLYLQPLYLSSLLAAQGLPPGWRASVVDGNNRIVARTLNPERFIGQVAPPGLEVRPAQDHDLRTGTSLEGEPILVAMQQMRLADWRVAVGVALSTVAAPRHATQRWLLVTGLATLAVASLLAWQLARSVARPLQRLSRAGNDMAAGLPVVPVQSSIAEVDGVSRALVRATQDLRDRAEALLAERAQLAAVIETVPVGLAIADADGRIVDGNRRLHDMLRHPVQRGGDGARPGTDWVASHADGTRVQPGDYPLHRVLHGAAAADLQCLYQRGDGTSAWISIIAAPILGSDGAVTGAVAALMDIDEVVRAREEQARFSDRLEHQVAERTAAAEAANQRLRDEMAARAAAEEQLHQAQKMEAVGQLTGGIAHDFNNLLTVIMGSLDLLRRRAENDRSRRLIDNALDGTTRAATLTARLLAFSRRQPLIPQAIDINRLVTGMSDLLHRTLGEAIQLETVLAGGVWQAHADPNQLENALLNLAVNGRDAIADRARAQDAPHEGRLVISTGHATLAADFAPHDAEFQPGDYVRVSVADNGTGMPPDVVARVFEPFFTTKPQGKGTGLGLSQVHGFVKQSGGLVTVDTTPGDSTTVSLFLPRLRAEPDTGHGPAEAGPAGAPRSGLTVLVVEDDAGVRHFSVEALRELGHAVLEAGMGPEALRLLDAHPEIDVLLTDIILPGQDGPALAAEARRRRPALPVLFASGYTGTDAMNAGLLPPGAPLLQKPYTVQTLAAKLEQVLGGT